MRRTTGTLAVWSAVGGGFLPLYPGNDRNYGGVSQGDGTYVTVLAHPDGRTLAIRTKLGDGWQCGPLVQVVAGGPWHLPGDGRVVHFWRGLRAWLNDHDPSREEPYCGGPWLRQPRPLDGRERDILGRILRDVIRAIAEGGEQQAQLLSVVHVDQVEVARIQEMIVILDARDD